MKKILIISSFILVIISISTIGYSIVSANETVFELEDILVYQENIDLDAQRYKSVIDLTNIDFSYIIKVYTNEGEYKQLPVGEIETDSNGKHIVRLGYRVQELTQEI